MPPSQIAIPFSACRQTGPILRDENHNYAGEASMKKVISFLLIVVAIIVIFLGAAFSALVLAGKTVTAQVTSYEQVIILNTDDSTRNPSRYKLMYQFAIDSKRYEGSYTGVFEKGSHTQKTLRVRYLPFSPHVNTMDKTEMLLAGPVLIGVGVLMLVGSRRRKSCKNLKNP